MNKLILLLAGPLPQGYSVENVVKRDWKINEE